MKSKPAVITFYTVDSPYEMEVKNLIESCRMFDIELHAEGIPSAGSWEMNCAFKPIFILKKLNALQRPVLWVDADAVFVRPLLYTEEFEADLSVRMNNLPDDHPSKVMTGTVYVNYTPQGISIVHSWAEECIRLLQNAERIEEFWEQEALRNIILSPCSASIAFLPLPYITIYSHPEDQLCEEPIIMHHQVSRLYKRWI